VLGGGIALFAVEQQALLLTGNVNLLPSVLLFGTLLVPVPFVVWVDGRAPQFTMPMTGLLIFGLLGGALGCAAASILETNTAHRYGGTLPTLIIGLIEEITKLMVPVIALIVTRDHTTPADGLLVGVAVGAGFAVLETLGYGFVTLLSTGGDVAATVGVLLLRGVLSPAAHIAWTGLASAALWHASARRWRPSAVLLAAGTFLLVVLLHAAWDAFPTWRTFVLIGGLSLTLLVRQTHRDVPFGGSAPGHGA
jgi:RsiW-degrading membrane proteinase PrsW (M82 family)